MDSQVAKVKQQYNELSEKDKDALSGVAAGRAGEFGYVVGVDRVGQAEGQRVEVRHLRPPGPRARGPRAGAGPG